MLFKRLTTLTTLISFLATSTLSLAPSAVMAAPIADCSNTSAVIHGQVPGCGGVTMGNQSIGFPTLQWDKVGAEFVIPKSTSSPLSIQGSSVSITANKAATALGVSSDKVLSTLQTFPSNVPMVVGRFGTANNLLKIDIYKIARQNAVAQLYHATFAPQHGDYWKANRSYIDPALRAAGNTWGKNPFDSFKGGDDAFHSISFSAAQVAVGHAQRLVGAPYSMLVIDGQRFDQQTSSSGWFVTTTTVTTKGFIKPRYMLGLPERVTSLSASLGRPGFCVDNPAVAADCPAYATATAGVLFQEMEGGTLSAQEDLVYQNQDSHSGLSLLGGILLVFIASFLVAEFLPALLNAAPATTGLGLGATPGYTGLLFSTGAANLGGAVIGSSLSAAAIDATAFGVLGALGGANLSTPIDSGLAFLTAGSVAKTDSGYGFHDLGQMNQHQRGLAQNVPAYVTGTLTTGMSGLKSTLYGGCAEGTLLSNCSSNSGVIPHVDQYSEQNTMIFFKDNNGVVIRSNDGTPLP